MKKLLWILFGLCCVFGIGNFSNAADCLDVKFNNGDSICVALEKSWTRYYAKLTTSNIGKNSALRCEILTPNDVLENLGACDGYFQYNSSSTEKVRMYVRYQNSEYKVIDADFNFRNGTWGSSSSSNSNSSSNNRLSISSNRTSPTTSQWNNITIETDSSYRDYVEFEVQYRSSSSSSWSTVSSTSYFDASSEFKNGYRFTSSDRGSVTLSSFIRFNRSGYYRLYVEDNDGNEDYVQFSVDTDSSSSNNSDITITSNRTSPTTSQWNNITIETNSSYRDYVEFEVQYRSSSSSSWSTVSSTSYFDASSEFRNGYRFTSSDNGRTTISSFIRFNRSGYYRLYVEDKDGNRDYVQFSVDTDSSSSNNNRLSITSNRTSPTTSQRNNITIETDSSYRDYVEFEVQYRSSSSSSWSTVSSTSYFDTSSEFRNGYTFTSSDSGYKTLNSFIRFNRSGYYRLYVEDRNGNEDYVQFSVDVSSSNNDRDNSNVDGFTVAELRKITNVSKIWSDVVAELERDSNKLRNDNYRHRLSDSFYTNMRDVVNDRSNRTFRDYDDFLDAFNERYRYTSRNS